VSAGTAIPQVLSAHPSISATPLALIRGFLRIKLIASSRWPGHISSILFVHERASSSYPLLNSLQVSRDVFFREAQRSTCAVTGQSFTSDLTHDRRAGDAATELLYIFNGVLRPLALKIRVNVHAQ
jgi:hypothetical protein